eukprot:Ihof_evm1s618 gene=Ihof_evmTU1s618
MTVEKYSVVKGSNTIDYVRLSHTDKASVEVNLYGATVTSYKCNNREWIFVSKEAVYDNKKAIRGGIPLVFPNFGPWSLGPQHGFARISQWKVLDQPDADVAIPIGAQAVSFELTDNEVTRKMWDFPFRLVMSLILTQDSLTQELKATNIGSNQFDFTTLLHTYFQCDDVSKVKVSGLNGCLYQDKVKGGEHIEQSKEVSVGEFCDRVYHGTGSTHTLSGLGGNTIKLSKAGFPETVVWNPWAENAQKMADFGNEE